MRHTVRIQRRRKSDAQMMFAWTNIFMKIVKWYAKPYIDAERAVIQDAKLEEIRIRSQVNEMRRQKLANELVLLDGKIALQNAELKRRGIGGNDFAPPSHYESEDQ